MEFSGFDANEEGEDDDVPQGLLSLPSPNAKTTVKREGNSLEALLATKNKRLQEELTKLRVSSYFCLLFWSLRSGPKILHVELEEQLSTSQTKLDQAIIELQRQKDLNEKLEVDLLSINKPTNEPATNDTDVDVLSSLDSSRKKVVCN